MRSICSTISEYEERIPKYLKLAKALIVLNTRERDPAVAQVRARMIREIVGEVRIFQNNIYRLIELGSVD